MAKQKKEEKGEGCLNEDDGRNKEKKKKTVGPGDLGIGI